MKGRLGKGLAALAAGMVLLSGCASGKAPERFTESFVGLFDTASTVTGYAESEQDFSNQMTRYEELLSEYDRLYDIYNDYDGINNLKTVNDQAGKAPVKVDQRIIDLLQFGKDVCTLSDGRVNICFGSVLSIWHDYREAGLEDPAAAELPPQQALEAAAKHTNIDDLVIDELSGTVYLADAEMQLDVGAIAKGYSAQRAAEKLSEEYDINAVFSIGGNVTAVGWKEEKEENPWVIGVENPDGGDYLMTVSVPAGMSLVTSGDYQRYYTVDGKSYHHIISPDTLYPAEYLRAVSVLASDSGLADALSTALFLMTLEQGKQLIDSMDGVEAVWVTDDGVFQSDGFSQYIR